MEQRETVHKEAEANVATLPDGTTKPLVFQGKGHYPNYVKTLPVILERDGGGYFKLLATFGYE